MIDLITTSLQAAKSLCMWTYAMDTYSKAAKIPWSFLGSFFTYVSPTVAASCIHESAKDFFKEITWQKIH